MNLFDYWGGGGVTEMIILDYEWGELRLQGGGIIAWETSN